MVRITYVYIDTVFVLFSYGYFFLFKYPPLLLCRMFEHEYLDTCCFTFLYLHLFSATEHVSHGKTL